MLTLRLAIITGAHSIAIFRDPTDIIERVVISEEDYRGLQSDLDVTKPYTTKSGRSIRPRLNSKMFGAVTFAKYDTADGFLAPGDYTDLSNGDLFLQREHTAKSKSQAWIFEDGEWTGNPKNPTSINADVIVKGERVQIISGVLQ